MKKPLLILILLTVFVSSCGGWYHRGPGYNRGPGGGYCWDDEYRGPANR